MILNLHGFTSTGNNSKFIALKEAFPGENIISPTLPLDPAGVIKVIDEIIQSSKEPMIVVGSSFGGFYAYYASAIYQKHCILVNPSLRPWKSLREAVGVHERFVTGEKFEWKKDYLTRLEDMDEVIKRVGVIESRLNFFLSNDDEVLDHSTVRHDYPGAARIKYFDDCGHRFLRFKEIVPEIRMLMERIR